MLPETADRKGFERLPSVPNTRRKFILSAAAAGIAILGADSVLIEPNRPRIVRQEIALRRWPERLNGFTIALLSDFHYDPVFSIHPIRKAIRMVNELRPDLILLTGDFVTLGLFKLKDEKAATAAEPCAALLRQLHAPHGSWAVMGNHDHFSDPARVTGALREAGVNVLNNQSAPIENDGARFWLAGVNDVLGGTADLQRTARGVPKDEATILMAHEPDYADYVARFPFVDLQVSGHSHGGQVRFPFVRPFYLPALARKYIWGLYHIGELTLYTNPGVGTVALPIRLNCPPEITVFSLSRATTLRAP